MRLLETTTFQFLEVASHLDVPYAIISHTWDPNGEQSYQDLRMLQEKSAGVDLQETYFDSSTVTCVSSTSGASPSPSIEMDPCLSEKIRSACAVVRAHGHRYLWIDSCCIDKTSSAELSEAINSMYVWYRDASICYAYLADVPSSCAAAASTPGNAIVSADPHMSKSRFRASRWFTRGWTLQELIAPRALLFLSADWCLLGTKASLAAIVEDVTGIARDVLTHRRPLGDVSVAQRMAWAARRACTRVEDEAYALMGLFDINMPTLYGEGRRAFVRLQQEILARIPDQTLLAWGPLGFDTLHQKDLPPLPPYAEPERKDSFLELDHFPPTPPKPPVGARRLFGFAHRAHAIPLFAWSPADFNQGGSLQSILHSEFVERVRIPALEPQVFAFSSYGVRTRMVLMRAQHSRLGALTGGYASPNWHLALLACEPRAHPGYLVALVCWVERGTSTGFLRLNGAEFGAPSEDADGSPWLRVIALSPDHLALCRAHLRVETVYVQSTTPLFESHGDLIKGIINAAPEDMEIKLAGWTEAVLRTQGYDVQHDHKRRHLALLEGETMITIGWFGRRYNAGPLLLTVSVKVFHDTTAHSATSPAKAAPAASMVLPTAQPIHFHTCMLGNDRLVEDCKVPRQGGSTVIIRVTLKPFSSSLGCLDVEALEDDQRYIP